MRFEKTNRIAREGVDAIVNPLDLWALGHALALRDADDDEVVVLTMGPAGASAVLEEALARGADRALHLLDRRFAGADTLATARALTHALKREQPDIVLLGRGTLDGATAQLTPQVAELLDAAQVTQATAIARSDDGLSVERETERGSETWTCPLPAVVSVERGPDPPEPGGSQTAEVEQIEAEELGGGPRDYGTRGSPTFVKEVRTLSHERAGEQVQGADDGARRIEELWGEIGSDRTAVPATGESGGPSAHGSPGESAESSSTGEPGAGGASRTIWVLAERDGDRLHPVSLEGVACAREVAGLLDAEIVSVLLCSDPGALADELAAGGADRVLLVSDPDLDEYSTSHFADALSQALQQSEPFAVVAPWTAQGRDYVPRVAARLGLGLTGDFVRLEVPDPEEDEPDLQWLKPAWAGTVEAPIIAHTEPALGMLRPGACQAPPSGRREAAVEMFEPELERRDGATCTSRDVQLEDALLLDSARVIVCAGGVGEAEIELAERLARAMDGALGATSAAVAAGLAAPQRDLGVSKRSLAPLLHIALGVEAEADLDSVRAAGTIVTVHPDAGAPAHGRADLAVVAEPAELAQALLKRLGSD